MFRRPNPGPQRSGGGPDLTDLAASLRSLERLESPLELFALLLLLLVLLLVVPLRGRRPATGGLRGVALPILERLVDEDDGADEGDAGQECEQGSKPCGAGHQEDPPSPPAWRRP